MGEVILLDLLLHSHFLVNIEIGKDTSIIDVVWGKYYFNEPKDMSTHCTIEKKLEFFNIS